MEPQIRHVRFFNGQFLRQDEFIEEQGYGNHMRRRLNYALFENGVVEITSTDLTIVREAPLTATNKRVRILRGMAVGSNTDVLEGKEIILRDDSDVWDLSTSFSAGDTVWATVNYRQSETMPVPLGSSTEFSRVEETAQIQFHRTLAAARMPTADGDPLIILGSVNFDSMAISRSDRQVARLRTALFAPIPTITFDVSSVSQGQVVTMTLTSGGGLDLTGLLTGDLFFQYDLEISAKSIIGTPTPTSAVIGFTVSAAATLGQQTLEVRKGTATASNRFTVLASAPAPTVTLTGADAFPGSTAFNALLVIHGTNFVGAVSVRFNNGGVVKSTFTGSGQSLSPTQISLRVPGSGVGSGTLTITADGGSVTTPPINIA